MILIDANILIYASVSGYAQHLSAKDWFDRQLNGSVPVGLPWASMLAYMRVTTNARIFPQPHPMATAWTHVRAWLACEPVWVPQPTERHAGILDTLISQPGMNANLVPDVHLAALAIEHGLTLCSADGDFARFSGLRWVNPLRPTTLGRHASSLA